MKPNIGAASSLQKALESVECFLLELSFPVSVVH